MKHRFGPWSSALGEGPSPHLSTFWKRRLALLGDARAAQRGPTRRDLLKLAAGGAAAFALPPLHLASAEGLGSRPRGAGKLYASAGFKKAEGEGVEEGLFVIDPDTAARTKVSDFSLLFHPSRDGRTLALERGQGDAREIDESGIWMLDAAGKGEMRRIAEVADFGGIIAWSPDGKQLIVAKSRSVIKTAESREELRRFNLDGLPPGGKITYIQDVRDLGAWRINADGSGAVRLPLPETERVGDWSPDGRWLATESDRHPPHGSGDQIYLMRPDGTDRRRLTDGPGTNGGPNFSPDGQQIAYSHRERGKRSIRIMDIDGGNHRTVLEEEGDTMIQQYCWAPDGKSLAFALADYPRGGQNRQLVFVPGPEKSRPRIVIAEIDGEGKRRTLDLPGTQYINCLRWC